MPDDKRRLRTHKDDDDRATVGAVYRATPGKGVPVRVDPESTGRCETYEDVWTMREDRANKERLRKIEANHDELREVVVEIRVSQGGLEGKLDMLLGFATKSDAAAESRRKYIVPVITALGVAVAGVIAAMAHGCS